MILYNFICMYKAEGTVLGWGGGAKQCLYHTFVLKGYNFVHRPRYICDFQYPLIYETILALLLYTDL